MITVGIFVLHMSINKFTIIKITILISSIIVLI